MRTKEFEISGLSAVIFQDMATGKFSFWINDGAIFNGYDRMIDAELAIWANFKNIILGNKVKRINFEKPEITKIIDRKGVSLYRCKEGVFNTRKQALIESAKAF